MFVSNVYPWYVSRNVAVVASVSLCIELSTVTFTITLPWIITRYNSSYKRLLNKLLNLPKTKPYWDESYVFIRCRDSVHRLHT